MAMHNHGHGYRDADPGAQKALRLAWVLGLVVLYMIAEVIGGLLTNSLALLADAGHMLSDAGALALSLFAIWIARRPSGPRRTYGYHRTEILAALVNGATLVIISAYILYEAFGRIGEPPEVKGAPMMSIALGGLLVNLAALAILNSGKRESLNVRGAWLHVLTDALGSVGAIVAGAMIWAFGWHWADPLASLAIALLVLYSSWGLLRETVDVLMEAAPAGIDVDEVRSAMLRTDGVKDVHDLHVWTITSGLPSLSAHVVVDETDFRQDTLERIRTRLHEDFDVDHVTIQLEQEDLEEMKTCA